MTKEQKVRVVRKAFRHISEKLNKDYEASILYHSELQGEISSIFAKVETKRQQDILRKIGLTEREYIEELLRIAKIETKFVFFVLATPWMNAPPAFNDMCIYQEV